MILHYETTNYLLISELYIKSINDINMKNLLCLLALLLCTTVFAQPQQLIVGVSGNGYVTRQQDGARITQKGVEHWTNPKSIVSIYFYLHQPTT